MLLTVLELSAVPGCVFWDPGCPQKGRAEGATPMVLRAKVCRMEAKGGRKEGGGGLGSFGPEPTGQQAPGADLQMRLLHGRGLAFNLFNIFAVRSHVRLTY